MILSQWTGTCSRYKTKEIIKEKVNWFVYMKQTHSWVQCTYILHEKDRKKESRPGARTRNVNKYVYAKLK